MEDFANLLQRDYGLKPQGKMAPMSAAKGASSSASDPVKGKSSSTNSNSNSGRSARTSFPGDDDLFFKPSSRTASYSEQSGGTYDDVFGGPPKFAPPKASSSSSAASIPVYDDIFRTQPQPTVPSSSSSKDNSLPVFDAPYEDDIFLGVRGTRSSGVAYDNVFGGASSSGNPSDDLLGGYRSSQKPKASPAFDDELLPGMGGSSYSSKPADPSSFIPVESEAPEPVKVDPFAGGIQPDPFSTMPSISDPLDSFTGYSTTKSSNGAQGDGLDGLDVFSQPNVKENVAKSAINRKISDSSDDSSKRNISKEADADDDSDELSPTKTPEDYIPASNFGSAGFPDSPARGSIKESWITVDDVKLVTELTLTPPPSRPPPGLAGYESSFPVKEESYTYDDPIEPSYTEEDINEAIRKAEAKAKHQKEKEAQRVKEREEQERLQREIEERERERYRKEKERELVDKANREARDRAAKAARERAERVAVEKALQESRMRAAADAKQKAEEAARQKADAEAAARQKADAEAARQKSDVEAAARQKADAERRAQRAAVERVNAEARERYEKAAALRAAEARAREQQQNQRSADDLDNFFGSRANSAPRQRPATPDFPKSTDRRSSGGAPVKKVSSVSSIDALTDLFDTSDPGFKDIDGETPDRRRARMERDQRTQARARQALEEKHRRDIAVQQEQAEKQRASASVDSEIKRWAAGKEGNIRALLSSLQYVLWPECGWQAVSLTELITGASVKKIYRKATLCVHPDKVQQKGATVQQKYIAEKVFDLLKEAWNKFNSEELF